MTEVPKLDLSITIGNTTIHGESMSEVISELIHNLQVEIRKYGLHVHLRQFTLAMGDDRLAAAVHDVMRSLHRILLINPQEDWIEMAVRHKIAS